MINFSAVAVAAAIHGQRTEAAYVGFLKKSSYNDGDKDKIDKIRGKTDKKYA